MGNLNYYEITPHIDDMFKKYADESIKAVEEFLNE